MDNLGTGGTELNAVRTAERLPRDQVEVVVAALNPEGPLHDRYDRAGFPVAAFPFPSFVSAGAVREGIRLKRWFREQQIDVAHAHDVYSNIFAVPWARAAGVPAVIASRRWGRGRSSLRNWANRGANRLAHLLVTNSQRGTELLREEGVAAERIRVLPNFLEDEAFDLMGPVERREALAALGIPPDAAVLGIVANLNPWKDHLTLIRAFARVAADMPGWYLVAFGEGEMRSAIESLAASLGIRARVRLPGHVPNRPNPHNLFDISTLASPDEGSPNSLLEAMAVGRPIVATNVGGIPDLVEHGVTGVLVPPRDPEALGEALLHLARDPLARNRLGRAARRKAQRDHSADAVLGKLLQLYDELASPHQPRQGVRP